MKKSVFVYIRIWQKTFEASLEHTSIFLAFLAKICSEFEENSNTCIILLRYLVWNLVVLGHTSMKSPTEESVR